MLPDSYSKKEVLGGFMIEESRLDVRICSKEMVDSARKNSRFYPNLTYFCIKRFFMFPTLLDYTGEEFMIIPETFFMCTIASTPVYCEDTSTKITALKHISALEYKLITENKEAADEFRKYVKEKHKEYRYKEIISSMANDIVGFLDHVANFMEDKFGGIKSGFKSYELVFCANEIKSVLDNIPLELIVENIGRAKEIYMYSMLKLRRYSQFDNKVVKKGDKNSNEYVAYLYNKSVGDMAGRLMDIILNHLKHIKHTHEEEQIIQKTEKVNTNEVKKYENEIENYKRNIKTLETRLDETTKKLDETTTDLNVLTAELDKITTKLNETGVKSCKTTKSLDEARKQYTSIIEENTLLKEEVKSHKQKLESQKSIKSIDFKEIELDKYSSQIPKNEFGDFFYTYLIKKLKVSKEMARIITKNYLDADAKKMISRAAADMSMSSFPKEKISHYTTIENAFDYVSAALPAAVFEKNKVQIKKEFERIISDNAANNEKTEQYFFGLIKMNDMYRIIKKYEKYR